MWNSNTDNLKYSRNSAEAWIKGCAQWMKHGIREGWKPYYLNFMFKPLHVPASELMPTMRKAIEVKFYGRFGTEFAHNTHSPSAQNKLPRFMLFPDLHCFKHREKLLNDNTINGDGLHFNGPMLIPPRSRFHECPIQHLRDNQTRYCRHGIDRIHIVPIYDADNLARYAAKTVEDGRVDEVDIIVLPRPVKELPSKKPITGSPQERLLKDIQAHYNVSDDVGRQMRDQIIARA